MLDANETFDLYASVVVANTEKALVNRLDSSIDSVKSAAGVKRRAVGIVGRTANTGYVVGRIEGAPVFTVDMATLNAMTFPLPLDIDIPDGQELTVSALSTTGTALVAVTILAQRTK